MAVLTNLAFFFFWFWKKSFSDLVMCDLKKFKIFLRVRDSCVGRISVALKRCEPRSWSVPGGVPSGYIGDGADFPLLLSQARTCGGRKLIITS